MAITITTGSNNFEHISGQISIPKTALVLNSSGSEFNSEMLDLLRDGFKTQGVFFVPISGSAPAEFGAILYKGQ